MCCSPMSQIWIETADILLEFGDTGIPEDELKDIVQRVGSENMPDPIDTCEQRGDLLALFTQLNEMGAAVAVCTTDDRHPTAVSLAHLGVDHLVVGSSCGDDGFEPKPDPGHIRRLQQEAGGIPNERTVMVGDTPTDMKLGRNGGVALAVGILGGASTTEDLLAHADCLIGDLTQLPKLVALLR
jgi:phosphoglycolate phosphatase-like HAD superfamily hydrolase